MTTYSFAGFTSFTAGTQGQYRVDSIRPIVGEGLPSAARLETVVSQTMPASASDALVQAAQAWRLVGVPSHVRYVEAPEREQLVKRQAGLGRPEATSCVLIPISKSPEWWALTQDQRRAIFEDKSRHIAESLKYLPAVARQLYHSRDLGQPFDFLTWFEFAPETTPMFDELLVMLRKTEEWKYVVREVELRLTR